MSIHSKVASLLQGKYTTSLIGNNAESISRWAKMTGIAVATAMAMTVASGVDADMPDPGIDTVSSYSITLDSVTPDMDDRFDFEGHGLSYTDTLHNGNTVFSSDAGGEHFERGKQITLDVLNALSGDRAQSANIYIVDTPAATDKLDGSYIDLSKPEALSLNGESSDREDLVISLSNIGDNSHFAGSSLQNAEFKSYHEAFHGIQFLDSSGIDNNLRILAGDSHSSTASAVYQTSTNFSADAGHNLYQEKLSGHVMADYVDHQYENGADVFATLAMHMDLNSQHPDPGSPEHKAAKTDLNDFLRGVMSDRQSNFANDHAHGTAPMLNKLRMELHKGNIEAPTSLEEAAKMTTQFLEDNKQMALDSFIKNYQNNIPTKFVGEDGQSIVLEDSDASIEIAMETIDSAANHAHSQLIDKSLSLNAAADGDVTPGATQVANLNLSLDLSGIGIHLPESLAQTPASGPHPLDNRLEKLREKRAESKLKLTL